MKYTQANKNNWKRRASKKVNRYEATFENDMNTVKNLVHTIKTNTIDAMQSVYLNTLYSFATH